MTVTKSRWPKCSTWMTVTLGWRGVVRRSTIWRCVHRRSVAADPYLTIFVNLQLVRACCWRRVCGWSSVWKCPFCRFGWWWSISVMSLWWIASLSWCTSRRVVASRSACNAQHTKAGRLHAFRVAGTRGWLSRCTSRRVVASRSPCNVDHTFGGRFLVLRAPALQVGLFEDILGVAVPVHFTGDFVCRNVS